MRVKKAKALGAMNAAWNRSEEYYDPARKEHILGRTKTRVELWEEHIKDPIAALAKVLDFFLKFPFRAGFWFVVCCCQSWWLQWPIVGAKIFEKMWEGPYWEGVWPCLGPWDFVRLRTSSS